MRTARGFTLVELMVVVALVGVLAVIALPRLGGRGRSARDTDAWSRTIASTLDHLRIRAMTERRRTQMTLRARSMTVEVQNPDLSWTVESTRSAPNDARVWDVKYTNAPPTAIMNDSTTHVVRFNSDFSVAVDPPSSVNANIYVAGSDTNELRQGRQYVVTVIASGAVARTDTW